MGYDRIAYFNGKDNESTLLSADKRSADVVYGNRFQFFCMNLGFKVREVVDAADVPCHRDDVNRGVQIDDLPARTKAEIIAGHRLAPGVFVELQPPVEEAMMNVLNAYFETHCDPSDSGLILDYRPERPKIIGGF